MAWAIDLQIVHFRHRIVGVTLVERRAACSTIATAAKTLGTICQNRFPATHAENTIHENWHYDC